MAQSVISGFHYRPLDARCGNYEGAPTTTRLFGLAEACGVSDVTMVLFLRDRGVYIRTCAVSRTRMNKGSPQRPTHISGKELSDAWWESNNQAFCDAMERGYAGMKFSDA